MGEPGSGTSDTCLTSVIRAVLEQLALQMRLRWRRLRPCRRDHPRWAVWVPAAAGEWAGPRPAGSRPPGPEVPMLWVRAGTAAELGGQMARADAGL